MKLNDGKFWMVSDPSPDSEWVDIFSGPHNWRFVLDAIAGAGRRGRYDDTVYDNEREARADAEKRANKAGLKYSYDRSNSDGH